MSAGVITARWVKSVGPFGMMQTRGDSATLLHEKALDARQGKQLSKATSIFSYEQAFDQTRWTPDNLDANSSFLVAPQQRGNDPMEGGLAPRLGVVPTRKMALAGALRFLSDTGPPRLNVHPQLRAIVAKKSLLCFNGWQ